MDISKNFLIGLLVDGQVNEFQAGYNSALIKVLKAFPDTNPIIHGEFYMKLKKGVNDSEIFNQMPVAKIMEMESNFQAGNSLMVVKLLKEATGLGLREAKDIFDVIKVMH